MESILFIETTKSGSSREAIKAAIRLGYFTVLLTERKSFLKQRKEFADVSQMIHLEELTEDLIRTEISQLQLQGKSSRRLSALWIHLYQSLHNFQMNFVVLSLFC